MHTFFGRCMYTCTCKFTSGLPLIFINNTCRYHATAKTSCAWCWLQNDARGHTHVYGPVAMKNTIQHLVKHFIDREVHTCQGHVHSCKCVWVYVKCPSGLPLTSINMMRRTWRQPTIGYRLASRYPILVVACCAFKKTDFQLQLGWEGKQAADCQWSRCFEHIRSSIIHARL